MEEHEIKTVIVKEQLTFKNVDIAYDAVYFYCELAEEFYEDEQQMQENYLKIQEAYNKKVAEKG